MTMRYSEESFAALLKKRPEIWNASLTTHKDAIIRKRKWAEIAVAFVEEEVTVTFLQQEYLKIRNRMNQRKRRHKKKSKSGSAGGETVANLSGDVWAFLAEGGGKAFGDHRETSLLTVAESAEEGDPDEPGEFEAAADDEDGNDLNWEDVEDGDDGEAERAAFLAAPFVTNSIEVIQGSRQAEVVQDCSAAAHAAWERRELGLRVGPSSSAAVGVVHGHGLLVLSPRGRRDRGLQLEGAPSLPAGSEGGAEDPPSTPQRPSKQRPPKRLKQGMPPQRYSPSDYESDASESGSVDSAGRRKDRRRAIKPAELAIIEENDERDGEAADGGAGDGVEGGLGQGDFFDLNDPVSPGGDGDAAQGSRHVSPPPSVEPRPSPPRNDRGGASGRGGRGGHAVRVRGGGRGGGRVGHEQHVNAERPQPEAPENEANGPGGMAEVGLTAAQRLQRAHDDRRRAMREVIRAQHQVHEERRRRGNREAGRGAGHRELLGPDDPRRLDTTAEVALLQQVLAEKEMDGFAHFGQSVACQLRSLRPSVAGVGMVRIQQVLNELREQNPE